jgi:hypothetical protein
VLKTGGPLVAGRDAVGRIDGTNRLDLRVWLPAIVAMLLLAVPAARAQQSSGPLIDPGQIVGGGTKQIRDNVRPVPGFLPKPELLTPGGAGQAVLVYRNPEAKWASYRKIMLDPIAIWAAPDSDLAKAPQNYRQGVANYFHAILTNTMRKRCALVNKPGPGTVRVKIALMDAKTPNPTVNTVATFAPYASTAYSLASLAFNKGVGYFAGSATAEGYVVDATTGTLLWQAVDKRGGTTTLIADTTDNWRDVRHIFEAWAQQITTKFTQMGVCR